MKNLFKNISLPVKILCVLVFITSFVLGFHNARLYDPNHGFDGDGHVYYVNYLVSYHKMPPPTEWETHQPPLYYLISAVVQSIFNSQKSVQYINTFVLWMIIIVAGLGLSRIIKDKVSVLFGMFALAALPMLNIFPAMVTNELLNTFWIITAVVSAIYFLTAKTGKSQTVCAIWIAVCLVLGVWTKVSIITALPTLAVAFIIAIFQKRIPTKRLVITGLLVFIAFGLAYAPIYIRASTSIGPSNLLSTVSKVNTFNSLNFYIRLDWIPKVDMYTTQYYSFLGGAWNSFWTDGQNAITPFVPFHKKSFVLWSLGFILLPICIYGLVKQWKKNKNLSIVINTLGFSMLAMYFVYNNMSSHYSAVRLTYEMAIVLPYAFGIAGAAEGKRMRTIICILLAIQFIILVSFYWIAPWWHVTRPI